MTYQNVLWLKILVSNLDLQVSRACSPHSLLPAMGQARPALRLTRDCLFASMLYTVMARLLELSLTQTARRTHVLSAHHHCPSEPGLLFTQSHTGHRPLRAEVKCLAHGGKYTQPRASENNSTLPLFHTPMTLGHTVKSKPHLVRCCGPEGAI